VTRKQSFMRLQQKTFLLQSHETLFPCPGSFTQFFFGRMQCNASLHCMLTQKNAQWVLLGFTVMYLLCYKIEKDCLISMKMAFATYLIKIIKF